VAKTVSGASDKLLDVLPLGSSSGRSPISISHALCLISVRRLRVTAVSDLWVDGSGAEKRRAPRADELRSPNGKAPNRRCGLESRIPTGL
jgi:hypothetical protein